MDSKRVLEWKIGKQERRKMLKKLLSNSATIYKTCTEYC